MNWDPGSYLKSLYASNPPKYAFRAQTTEEWKKWQDELRANFVELLGGYPKGEPDLHPVVLETADCGSYIRQRMEMQTYPGLKMPFYLLIPKRRSGKTTAVIACHGHGHGGSKAIVGLNADGTERDGDGEAEYQKDFAVDLVNRGYLTLVPELLGFGDRKLREDADSHSSCHTISTFLLAMGETMAGHRVFETLRCVDYLLNRDDADAGRIGCMGISGGGLVSLFAAAIDERIGAVAVSGFVNTFEASILSVFHCVDNYIPGLSRIAEMPDLAGLIAPRPLLVEAGKEDPIFPLQGTIAAYGRLSEIYGLLNAREHLDIDLFEGGHEISGAKSFDWFKRLQRQEERR